jgi:hypothetical protein
VTIARRALGYALSLALLAPPAAAQEEGSGEGTATAEVLVCNEQLPQEFLIRANYIRRRGMTDEEKDRADEVHAQAIRYRTEQYGYFEGVGDESWNDRSPAQNSARTTFMGIGLRLNERVIPALRCVEEAILAECADTPFQPEHYSALRDRPTPGRETSNHVYGIAIDIDPADNTCCGCVGEWAEDPLCHTGSPEIFDRMTIPRCWVKQFSRFGWYWYGHEDIQDTMHFDFLGDPDAIMVPALPEPSPRPQND